MAYIQDTPRIFIQCLAAYSEGKLHGDWFDVTCVDQLQEDIQKVLSTSPVKDAEEYFFADTECLPSVREYSEVEHVIGVADLVLAHGEEVASAGLDWYSDPDDAHDFIQSCYRGEWDSFVDYAKDLVDQNYLEELSEFARDYFDYEKFAADLKHDYDIVVSNGRVLIFSNYY